LPTILQAPTQLPPNKNAYDYSSTQPNLDDNNNNKQTEYEQGINKLKFLSIKNLNLTKKILIQKILKMSNYILLLKLNLFFPFLIFK
jgi:hypothetical protein